MEYHKVALLAEGVDRNKRDYSLLTTMNESPSSRRAWIEMLGTVMDDGAVGVALLAEGVDRNTTANTSPLTSHVALLAEGVDRNTMASYCSAGLPSSPSSRRAWIEIAKTPSSPRWKADVALLAEGVDRNRASEEYQSYVESRPPRGGRG